MISHAREASLQTGAKIKKGLRGVAQALVIIGAPGPIRTADNLVRSQGLYPAELRALEVLRH